LPWKQRKALDERKDFIEEWNRQEVSLAELCRRYPQPRVINTDLAPIYGSAIPDLKKDGILRRRCRHRPVQYLNNILEQDHRAIKRRVNAKQGFREFQAAQRTIQRYEAMNHAAEGAGSVGERN
jgi:transposase-like protein